ncbi:hypothetical protein FQJ65_01165 [Escherichia coli]|nr:hypothetical protein [Escherichia coli]
MAQIVVISAHNCISTDTRRKERMKLRDDLGRLCRLYSNLVGVAEERNGKPLYPYYMPSKNRREGYEIHHITSRSHKGSNQPFNLVYFTPREHYLAHQILAYIYGGGMSFAFMRMSTKQSESKGRKYRVTSRQYETARSLNAVAMLGNTYGTGNKSRTGHKMSAETCAKMSKSKTGVKHSPEHVKNRADSFRGFRHSEETKALISEKKKGRKLSPEHRQKSAEHLRSLERCAMSEETKEKIRAALKGIKRGPDSPETRAKKAAAQVGKVHERKACEHCGYMASLANYARWHGDNCKHKPS